MVHGIDPLIRYVIQLEQPIDYYNDLLLLCIKMRKMFQLIDNDKIVVINDINYNINSKYNYVGICHSTFTSRRFDENGLVKLDNNCKAMLYSKYFKFSRANNHNDDEIMSLINENNNIDEIIAVEKDLTNIPLSESENNIIAEVNKYLTENNFRIKNQGIQFLEIHY